MEQIRPGKESPGSVSNSRGCPLPGPPLSDPAPFGVGCDTQQRLEPPAFLKRNAPPQDVTSTQIAGAFATVTA